ncbi:tRNA guanosine-2'-O-methyltransferase TRM13 [Angomonas deanei]|uniref:tRNA:m(4)X modification enzyme TRM13 n=1 Tax=Angomonas deanei TaxID=59799 RepID=A0A7G2CLY0_9TRYP|nr:tRNA guanosine-2'-O-methyltransferase TRM13 [Angomonas deanei]CAD2219931.1 Methyltransferase domain/Methyltransferase TRM13, putative [Angomonas deanei]|eukprot:EPY27518.1 tRNA guanosine-2'-O-methyltransferase TRM13 [Angomonas deanei]
MDQLWTVSLSTAYTKALQRAREQRLEAFRQNSQRPKEKFEAGLISRDVLCGDVSSPLSASWRKLIDRYSPIIPDRSHVHELENLPQEIAIGELLDECVSQVRVKEPHFKLDLIVDVGGGNGYVSAILGEHQCCDNAVIDPLFPGHSIDCRPRLWADTVAAERAYPSKRRQYTTHRRVALFKDTTWSEDIGTDPSRTAFIAKHLCGSAIDECLRHLEQQKCLPRILVLAPCCFNKINYDSYLNPKYLKDTFSIFGSEALRRVAPLTDWNLSYYQHLQDEATRHKKRSSNVEDDACGCGANYKVWQSETVPSVRDGGKGTVAEMIPCMHGLSQYVEHRINYGRVLWLTERGYTVRLLQYVPPFVTPKNKCIIAIRT